MSEAQDYRAKAVELSELAKKEQSPSVRERLLRNERTCLLIARNAEWLESTDQFLRDLRGY
jgi:hypothetical protein